MSADTRPIAPARFAAALKELSIEMMHLKVLEIRNSIAHLQYSNDQLRPFAEGSATALTDETTHASNTSGININGNTNNGSGGGEPDPDCVEAIRENEVVIDRMAERIALVRAEVEERGVSWAEFQSKEEADAARADQQQQQQQQQDNNGDHDSNTSTNGTVNGIAATERSTTGQHAAWSDGTFQTGTIHNGQVQLDSQPGRPSQGGSMNDEELRRAMEEQLRNLGADEDQEDGMHL